MEIVYGVIVKDLEVAFSNLSYLTKLCKSTDVQGNYTWAKTHQWDKCVREYIKLYKEILEC